MIIEGAIAVKAAILAKKRKINRVYMDQDKKTKDFGYLRFLIRENQIPLTELPRVELETLTSGKTHGGICADVEARHYNETLEANQDVFYIDGIEDPFNFGYICRTLYAFGIKEVIIPKRDLSNMEAALLKSSAGAFEYLNIIQVDDPLILLQNLKAKNYRSYALYRGSEAKDIFEVNFHNPSIFLLGGEKRGISSKVLNEVDEYVYIPYGQDFRNALNASSALTVVATLLFQQRKNA